MLEAARDFSQCSELCILHYIVRCSQHVTRITVNCPQLHRGLVSEDGSERRIPTRLTRQREARRVIERHVSVG